MSEWEKFREKIVNLQGDLSPFKVEFLDQDTFKEFFDHILDAVGVWTDVCITGYFSETIRQPLERIIGHQEKWRRVRLMCQELDTKNKRDLKNLEVLKRLNKAGVEIKINNRLHARFFVAYNHGRKEISGLLVIGSFDFNTECIGKERFDAGIKTTHPDLVRSAIELFDKIWEEPGSSPLLEKYS